MHEGMSTDIHSQIGHTDLRLQGLLSDSASVYLIAASLNIQFWAAAMSFANWMRKTTTKRGNDGRGQSATMMARDIESRDKLRDVPGSSGDERKDRDNTAKQPVHWFSPLLIRAARAHSGGGSADTQRASPTLALTLTPPPTTKKPLAPPPPPPGTLSLS